MIMTWLTGKPRNGMYMLQKAIDDLNKTLESLKQQEEVKLEEAAIRLEEAKEHCRQNYKHRALHCLKIMMMHERAAQHRRNLQRIVQEELIFMERVKKELTEALQDKDLTTQKTTTTHVFINFCLLVLVLTYFVAHFIGL